MKYNDSSSLHFQSFISLKMTLHCFAVVFMQQFLEMFRDGTSLKTKRHQVLSEKLKGINGREDNHEMYATKPIADRDWG